MSLQFLEFCDSILLLEDGKVLEDGDHAQLLRAGGRYAQLISSYQTKEPQVSGAPGPKADLRPSPGAAQCRANVITC